MRGQKWFAVRHLNDVRQQLLVLARLIHSTDPADFYFVEKQIEKDLGEDACAAFAQTLPSYDLQSIWDSLRFCVEWYENEAPAYANRIGAAYPTEAARQIAITVFPR
jgi:hypothetical protein